MIGILVIRIPSLIICTYFFSNSASSSASSSCNQQMHHPASISIFRYINARNQQQRQRWRHASAPATLTSTNSLSGGLNNGSSGVVGCSRNNPISSANLSRWSAGCHIYQLKAILPTSATCKPCGKCAYGNPLRGPISQQLTNQGVLICGLYCPHQYEWNPFGRGKP